MFWTIMPKGFNFIKYMQIFQPHDPCLIWHLDWMELRCSSEDPAVQFQEARLWCPESTKISLTERSSIFILHYQRDTLLPCQDSWLVSSIIMIAVSLQGGIWTWRINWHCRQAQKGRFMCREKHRNVCRRSGQILCLGWHHWVCPH